MREPRQQQHTNLSNPQNKVASPQLSRAKQKVAQTPSKKPPAVKYSSSSTRPSSSNSTTLYVIVGLITLVLGGFMLKKLDGTSGKASTLEISGSPDSMRITMNNRPLFNNRHTKMPAVIKDLPAGRLNLTFSHDGYAPESVTLASASDRSNMKPVRLKATEPMAPVIVTLDQNAGSVNIDIDEGMFEGEIAAGKVVQIKDVKFGDWHSLVVLPNYPNKSGAFQCRFVPRAQTWKAPFHIIVNLTSRQCLYRSS
jgi:hypothetical protein